MKQLLRDDIHLGKALPYSVYDRHGNLLLRRGFVLSYEEQLLRLLQRGMFIGGETTRARKPAPAPQAVYQLIGAATLRLKVLVNDLVSPVPSADVPERIRGLARELLLAVRRDPDAAIAAVHMDSHNVYLLAHMVHAAVLAALIAPRLSLDEKQNMTLMVACLTYDIGMLEILHLEKQKEPLNDAQRIQLARHPEQAGHALRKAGISDALWLALAQQHHERLDGSGYPHGLGVDHLEPLAGVLTTLDVYLAMVKPRPWREALVPLVALREIHAAGGAALPGNACTALVRELGLYPPGTLVRLQNEEIALVFERGADLHKPVIYSIFERSGIPRMVPRLLDGNDPRHAVMAALGNSEGRAAALIMARLWSGR